MANSNAKIPLPQFLKILSNNNVSVQKAMTIAGKVYKVHNTPDALAQLNDAKLQELGLDNKEDRKFLIAALIKAGYTNKMTPIRRKVMLSSEAEISHTATPKQIPSASSSPNHPTLITTPSKSPKRKRKEIDDRNEFLAIGPTDEHEHESTWDFKEVLDDNLLKLKYCVVNRAPVMMAWSMLVAEKMDFSRAEALSIASVYTEMNAVTKGVSLGIYKTDEERGREAEKGGSQPYVELIGRRPLYRTKNDQWRALSNGKPVSPNTAFQYISRSFRQTTPFIMGALKLLANSYAPQELNEKAWGLYAEFRPEVNEWGKRSEIWGSRILNLRKKSHTSDKPTNQAVDQAQEPQVLYSTETLEQEVEEPIRKKIKPLTVEDYEAILDQGMLAKVDHES